jgi:hypothetical protein
MRLLLCALKQRDGCGLGYLCELVLHHSAVTLVGGGKHVQWTYNTTHW